MTAPAGKIPAVFLDRDNTLNVDHGYTHRIEDFAWIPGAPEALELFHRHGLACFLVTNQGGIGKGLFSIAQMTAFNDHLCREAEGAGGRITDIAFCAHHPQAVEARWKTPCSHRKPEPGMILALAERWNIDLAASVMIGDRDSDVAAGTAAGCHAYKFDGKLDGGNLAVLARHILTQHFGDSGKDATHE